MLVHPEIKRKMDAPGTHENHMCSLCSIFERELMGLDDRQITHLIGVRLKDLLYDFLGVVLGLLPVVFLKKT